MKKWFVLLLALVMTATMLPVAAMAEESEEKVLTMWYWDNPTYKALFEAFKAETGADFSIDFVDVATGDYTSKFLANLAGGGELPDIVSLEIGYRQRLMDIDGLLEVLTEEPYGYDASLVSDYIPNLLTNAKGDLVCVDGQTMGSGVIYKRGIAKQYLGTDVPEELEALLPDWDAVAALGAKVYEESNGEVYLFATVNDINQIISGQATVPIVTTDGTINREEILRRLEILENMKLNNVYDPESFGGTNDFDVSQTYSADNHIMYATAPWGPRYVFKPNDPDRVAGWGIMGAPGGGYSWGGLALGILSSSEYKEEAWQFIEWASLTEAGAQWQLVNAGEVSNLKSFLSNASNFDGREDEYFAGQNVTQKFAEICLGIEKLNPLTKYDQIVAEAFGNAMLSLIMDGTDVETLVDEVVEEIEYLSEEL